MIQPPGPAPSGLVEPPESTGGSPHAARSTVARTVHRWDPVPLASTVIVVVVGSLVLVALDGSYAGLTITVGIAYAVVTVGMVLQLGYSKQLAFSQSVFMGVGAYGTGILEVKYHFNSAESLACVIAMAAIASLLVGSIVTRAPGLALALATLLLPLFLYELATFSGYLGSFSGIDGILPFWNGPTYQSALVRSGVVSVVLLGLATGLVLRVTRSGVGLQLMAMGEDESLAESIGVSLRQRRLEVFVAGSVLAAVGGAILVSAQGLVTPDVLAESAELTLLIMLFVSGRKSVTAAILGAIVIEYLSTSTSFISTNLGTIEGVVLIVVLLVEPNGVAGAASRLLRVQAEGLGKALRARYGGVRRAGR